MNGIRKHAPTAVLAAALAIFGFIDVPIVYMSIRWFRTCGTATRSQDGSPQRMIGTFTDVTDRRRAEESLRLSEATLRSSYQEIQDLAGKMKFVGFFSAAFGVLALLICLFTVLYIFRDRLPSGFREKAAEY